MFVPVNKLFTLDISWTYLEHIHDYIKDRNDKVFSGRLASCISFGQQSTTTKCIGVRLLFFMSLRIRKIRYNSLFKWMRIFFIITCYLITFSQGYENDDSSMSVVAFLNATYINVCDTCVAILNVLYWYDTILEMVVKHMNERWYSMIPGGIY